MSELLVVPNSDALAREAANRFTALASSATAERGRFLVALSGGSTPRPVYALLADKPVCSQIDWTRVHVFWGDERCVPPDHPDSNYRMASQALLERVPIPRENVHRIRSELEPRKAAALYGQALTGVLGEDRRIDLVILGLGTDGHTASLFPGTTALQERERDVVAVYVERIAAWRVTLTLPLINAGRQVMFLVAGVGKAAALAQVLAGEELPAGLVKPQDGKLTWLVDRGAAKDLGQEHAFCTPAGPTRTKDR